MKLTDLHPRWVGAGGDGITDNTGKPVPERTGIGVSFDCPCGKCGYLCFVPFQNPIDGGPPTITSYPLWTRTGDDFDTLTLTPSILRATERGGCGWHGFITNGEVSTV